MKNTPTQEQLFDYYLGLTNHSQTKEIESYIAQHPEIKNTLAEFKEIETGFTSFPLTSPSDAVLNQVRQNALKQMRPNYFESIKSFLIRPIPIRRSLAWSTMVIIVFGLSLALSELRKTDIYSAPVVSKSKPAVTETLAHFVGNKNPTPLTPVSIHLPTTTNTELYNQALMLYQQNQFAQANVLFSQIMSQEPLFSKRIELYNTWILSLEKNNDPTQAQQKRQELLKIQEDTKLKEVM